MATPVLPGRFNHATALPREAGFLSATCFWTPARSHSSTPILFLNPIASTGLKRSRECLLGRFCLYWLDEATTVESRAESEPLHCCNNSFAFGSLVAASNSSIKAARWPTWSVLRVPGIAKKFWLSEVEVVLRPSTWGSPCGCSKAELTNPTWLPPRTGARIRQANSELQFWTA